MATREEMLGALRNAHDAGDTEAASRIAGMLSSAPAEAAPKEAMGDHIKSIGKKALGLGEAALSLGTGATSGAFGLAVGGLQGVLNQALQGNFGTPEGVAESGKAAMEGAQSLTYEPRSDYGKEYAGAAGEWAMKNLPALVAAEPQLTALIRNRAAHQQAQKAMRDTDIPPTAAAPDGAPPQQPPGSPPGKPTMSPEWSSARAELERILSENGLMPESAAQAAPEQPLPFVPELYDPTIAPLPGRKGKKYTPTATEAERMAAEEAAAHEALGKKMPWRRTADEMTQPEIRDFVPQEEGLPFSREQKLSTPIEVATHSRDVQQGIRDVNELTGQREAMAQEGRGLPELGPEFQQALQGLDYDLGNAQQRTAGHLEGALDIGRDIGQLKIQRAGEEPTVPTATWNPPRGQTSMGKGQRGSINFFGKGKDARERFFDEERRARPGVTQQELDLTWSIRQQQEALSQTEQTRTQASGYPKYKTTITGPNDKVEFLDLTPEKVLEDLKIAEDSAKGENFFEKHLLPGGYMKAFAANNPAVSQTLRYLKSVLDRNANRAEHMLYRQGSARNNWDSGFMHDMTKFEKVFGKDDMSNLIAQWFKAKDNPDYKFTLTGKQQVVYDKIKAAMDRMLNEVNSYLPEGKQIDALPNYIPSVHDGKFVLEVVAPAADGSRTRPILYGHHNKVAATAMRKWLQAKGYEVGEIKTRPDADKYGDTSVSRAANYQYMLELLNDSNPMVRELGKALTSEAGWRATTVSGRHQHFKDYAGFKGELGNNPLKSEKANYFDAKKMLEEHVRSHYEWVAAQEGHKFLKMMEEAGSEIGPNNRDIITNYINDSVIGRRFHSEIDRVLFDLVESVTGTSPQMAKKLTSNVGNVLTAMATSMGSPIHALQNIVQPLTVMMPQMLAQGMHPVLMTKALTKGAAEYLYVFGGKQVGEIGKLLGADSVEILGSKSFNEKMNFAERAGIIAPTIVDARAMTNNKIINRGVQFGLQGFLSKPTEQAARWTVFSQMADFYQSTGMSKQEAFNRAKEVAETYMTDYGPDAKANLWKNAGFVGNLAGRLQQFATNQFGTTYTLGKKAIKQRDLPSVAAFTGYLGTLVALGGLVGMPLYDAFESVINSLMSRQGKSFSLRNQMRETVGNWASEGVWGQMGIGAAPSFASRSINTSGEVPLPSMLGLPAFGKVPEMARAGTRRAFGKVPWDAETEAEKGREITSIAPAVATPWIEDAYLKEQVGDRTHNVSPKTGRVLHTAEGPETSVGNIRSRERSADTELSNEYYKGEERFKEQKKVARAELDGLIRDIYQYGNGNAIKEQRLLKDYRKYVKDYTGDPMEAQKILEEIRSHVGENYTAAFATLSKKENPTLEDVRKLLKNKEYRDLRKKAVGE